MIGRITEILPAETATVAATRTIDLNISDPITQIMIVFRGTNNAVIPVAHGAQMITRIEVVDGSDLLCSMTGAEAQAMSYHHLRCFPLTVNEYAAPTQNIQTFNINFGRYLWDREIALDPKRFNNLQLKITHTIALGASSPNAGSLAVFAQVFNPNICNPAGFIMNKELYAYSLVSAGMETITLPSDYKYKGLMIQSLFTQLAPQDQIQRITLSVDNDARVLINNLAVTDILKYLGTGQPITEYVCGQLSGAARWYFTSIGYNGVISVSAVGTALASVVCSQLTGGSFSVNGDAGEMFQALVQGYCPHNSFFIPFGHPEKPEDYLDVSQISRLILKLTGGAAVGAASTAQVVAAQLRIY
jgi:hypothetical protein